MHIMILTITLTICLPDTFATIKMSIKTVSTDGASKQEYFSNLTSLSLIDTMQTILCTLQIDN